jgi:hypothetical protein
LYINWGAGYDPAVMTLEPQPPRTLQAEIETTADAVIGNPYVHFMISEASAGLTSVVVYLFFRAASYATQFVTQYLPLHDRAPSDFLELVLSWGAALSASATFVIVTVYQLLVLIKRLRADF